VTCLVFSRGSNLESYLENLVSGVNWAVGNPSGQSLIGLIDTGSWYWLSS